MDDLAFKGPLPVSTRNDACEIGVILTYNSSRLRGDKRRKLQLLNQAKQ